MHGVLAQLGARHIRIVEATGSNPVYSINTAESDYIIQRLCFFITHIIRMRLHSRCH